jgi:hypothetical protein
LEEQQREATHLRRTVHQLDRLGCLDHHGHMMPPRDPDEDEEDDGDEEDEGEEEPPIVREPDED